MSTAFDAALAQQDLYEEAEEYALRHGSRGMDAYLAAWVRFRGRVKTPEDLGRWRRARAAKMARAGRQPGARTGGSDRHQPPSRDHPRVG